MSLPNNKRIAIIGGGTHTYISNHLALSAPAYGATAKILENKFQNHPENKLQVDLYLTKMAGGLEKRNSILHSIQHRKQTILDPRQSENNVRIIKKSIDELEDLLKYHPELDTPEDIEALVDKLIADPDTRVIIFNVAMVDYKPVMAFGKENGTISAKLTYKADGAKEFGKYVKRLSTSEVKSLHINLEPHKKIINKIRKERKDILLVGFKTTCGAPKEEMFNKGLKLCKDASANIVFVNDVDKERISNLNKALALKKECLTKPVKYLNTVIDFKKDSVLPSIISKANGTLTFKDLDTLLEREIGINELQNNGLVTPEESSYWYNTRDEALDALVQMVLDRSHLHFTRSTVVDSETVPWNITKKTKVMYGASTVIQSGQTKITKVPNPLIPQTFRTVFDFVRGAGAYKKGPTGNTVGHFGIALGPNEFLTSKRKTDFNKIEEVGLVRVITDDPDDVFGYKHFFEENHDDQIQYNSDQAVIAFGAKPSVGGQSQRSLFDTYPDLNCIVHFHCPLKPESRPLFTTTPQFSYECGSKECIASNITGFKEYKVSPTHSIWAGHMDHHGPNIVFNSDINPQLVIDFIDTHWDLSKKTDGLSEENI